MCVCMYVCMCVCMYICLYVSMCVCMYSLSIVRFLQHTNCRACHASKSRACRAKIDAERQQVARLPRETEAQRRGAQVPRQSVHHSPWRAASRTPATQNRSTEARTEPQRRGAQVPRPGAHVPRQSVHHGPWRAASRAPATRNPSRARAYITALGEQQVARLPHETEAQRRGAQVPRQSVHHSPWRAASRAPATRNPSTEARSPGAAPERTSRPLESSKSRACHAKLKHRGTEPRCRARAYITALGEQQVARLPRETQAQRRGAQVPRQSVHHGCWRAASRAPATRN